MDPKLRRASLRALSLVALVPWILAATPDPAPAPAVGTQRPGHAQDAKVDVQGPPGYRQYRDANGVLHVTNVEVADRAALVRGRAAPPVAPVQAPAAGASLAERARPYNAIIEQAAKQYQLPVALVRAVVRTESNYNPRARSYKGAMGLMQLMPATARWLGVEDAYDPVQNVFGGAKFLRLLANRFKGDMVLVIAGYHAGAGAVQKYGGVPPYATTRAYVKAVMRRFYKYRGQRRAP